VRTRTRRHIGLVLLVVAGCGGPGEREIGNARAFEALLTAVSLKDAREVEADAERIEARHDSGELSDRNYRVMQEIVARARAKEWAGAERQAYEFRKRFGDEGAYFR
jgi:hypothetical protein